jgi:putative hydrolases of HD superfamily
MMALVHDMAESIVGDITPHDGVSKGHSMQGRLMEEEKHRQEMEAMKHLVSLLPGPFAPNAKEMQTLFEEYEEGKTEEAIIVKDIDKYELLVQALEYQRDAAQRGDNLSGVKDLSRFYGARRFIKTDLIQGWADEVLRQRDLLLHKGIPETSANDTSE